MKKFNVQDRILEKAVDLFYMHGFYKASIRDIVRAVGISNSSVYIYFKNKDEILYSIIVDIGADLLEELRKAISRHNDPVECLREMIFRQISLSISKYKKMKIYLEEQYLLPPKLRNKARKQHREIYDLYYSKVREIQDKRLLHSIDATVATFGIFAMMNWIYRWFDPHGRLSLGEVADQTIDMFFRSILREPNHFLTTAREGEN